MDFITFTTFLLLPLLGLAFGSFLTMLIPRIKNNESGIVLGRSKCPNCSKLLSFSELIPLFSYIFQKGACKQCKKKISTIYPIIEITTAIAFTIIGYKFLYLENLSDPKILGLFLFYTLILLFIIFYDILYLEISDLIMIPAILIAILASFFPNKFIPNTFDALLGMTIPVSFFLIQIIISKGKWIGGGDLRIGALMGLILGWKLTLTALFLSYLSGTIINIPLLLSKNKTLKSQVPFGPFLSLGTFIAILYGEELLKWYLKFISL